MEFFLYFVCVAYERLYRACSNLRPWLAGLVVGCMVGSVARAQQAPGLSLKEQAELLQFTQENFDQESTKKILKCHKDASLAPTPSRYLQGFMSCIIHEAADANFKREKAELVLRAAQAPAVKQLVAALDKAMNQQPIRDLQSAFDGWLATNDLSRYPVVKAYLTASKPLFAYQAVLRTISKRVFADKHVFCLAFGLPKPATCTKTCQPVGPAGSIDYQCLDDAGWKKHWDSEQGALQMCAPLAPKLHLPHTEPTTKGLFTTGGDLNARFYCPKEKNPRPKKENEFLKALWERLEKNPSVDSADALWATALTRGAKRGPWGWADNVRLHVLRHQLHNFRIELGMESDPFLRTVPGACQASPTLTKAWQLPPHPKVEEIMKERTESLYSDFYLEEMRKQALDLQAKIAQRKKIAEEETTYAIWKQANLLQLDVTIARLQAQISFVEDPHKALLAIQNKEGTFREKRMELETPLRQARAQRAAIPELNRAIRALEKQILAHREQPEEITEPCKTLQELDEKRANAAQESVLLDEKNEDLQAFIDKIWEENSHWKSVWVAQFRRMDDNERKHHLEEVRAQLAKALKEQHEMKKMLTSEEQEATLKELDRHIFVAFHLNRILFGDYYTKDYLPEALTKAEPHFLTEFAIPPTQGELALNENIAELEAQRDALLPKPDEFEMFQEEQTSLTESTHPIPSHPPKTTSLQRKRASSIASAKPSSTISGSDTKELTIQRIHQRLWIMKGLRQDLYVRPRVEKLRKIMKQAIAALGSRWSSEIGELCLLGGDSSVFTIASKLYNNEKIGSTYTLRHLLSYETQLYNRDQTLGHGVKTALLSQLPEYLPMHQCMEEQLNARGDQHQGASKALGGEIPGGQKEDFHPADLTKGMANACVTGIGCPAVIWLDGQSNARRAQALTELCSIPGSLCSKRDLQELIAAKDAAKFKKWFGIIFGALEGLLLLGAL